VVGRLDAGADDFSPSRLASASCWHACSSSCRSFGRRERHWGVPPPGFAVLKSGLDLRVDLSSTRLMRRENAGSTLSSNEFKLLGAAREEAAGRVMIARGNSQQVWGPKFRQRGPLLRLCMNQCMGEKKRKKKKKKETRKPMSHRAQDTCSPTGCMLQPRICMNASNVGIAAIEIVSNL